MENIGFDGAEKLVGVSRVILGFHKTRYPFQLLIHLLLGAFARLIFPMRRDTVLGNVRICTSKGIPSRPMTVV